MFYNRMDIKNVSLYKTPLLNGERISVNTFNSENTGYDCCQFQIRSSRESLLATGWLNEVPLCCGAVFISGIYSYDGKKGYGTKMMSILLEAAELGGYSQAQCIIASDIFENNIRRILSKFGFVEATRNLNKRTGNKIYTFHKDLTE